MRVWRAAFYRFPGDRNSSLDDERDVLAAQVLNGIDLLYLATGYAGLGEFEVAIELLRDNARQGRLAEREVFLTNLAPQLVASPAFAEFRVEHQALRDRLREQYGTDLSP